jgi:hypothetical protein
VGVVVNLPVARAGLRRVSARLAQGNGSRTAGGLLMLVDDGARAALERGWVLTIAAALGQLPSRTCLTVRDANGREWYVSPAAPATATAAASFGGLCDGAPR